jgi:hypothetical protein
MYRSLGGCVDPEMKCQGGDGSEFQYQNQKMVIPELSHLLVTASSTSRVSSARLITRLSRWKPKKVNNGFHILLSQPHYFFLQLDLTPLSSSCSVLLFSTKQTLPVRVYNDQFLLGKCLLLTINTGARADSIAAPLHTGSRWWSL